MIFSVRLRLQAIAVRWIRTEALATPETVINFVATDRAIYRSRIDFLALEEHFEAQMKALFRHFLFLGAIFGLLWQGVAYASPPCADMQQEQSVAMAAMDGMEDCVESEEQSSHNIPPCKDMSAGCFAMVGCATLVALEVPPVAVSVPTNTDLSYSQVASPVLIGRNEIPIPDPPSILG